MRPKKENHIDTSDGLNKNNSNSVCNDRLDWKRTKKLLVTCTFLIKGGNNLQMTYSILLKTTLHFTYSGKKTFCREKAEMLSTCGFPFKQKSGMVCCQQVIPAMKGIVEEFCPTFIIQEGGEVVGGSSFMWDKCLEEIQEHVRVQESKIKVCFCL